MKIIAFTLVMFSAVFLVASAFAYQYQTKTVYIMRRNGPTEVCQVTMLGDTENWTCS